MIEINFYEKYDISWDELREMAISVIKQADKLEQELNEINDDFDDEDDDDFDDDFDDNDFDLYEDLGGLPDKQINSDYLTAVELGLKTFIFEVLNEWGDLDLLYIDDKIYKKFEILEMDKSFKSMYDNVFLDKKELFDKFREESILLDYDQVDFITDNFTKNVITTIFSYENIYKNNDL